MHVVLVELALKFLEKIDNHTWKKVKKKSSFFLAEPRSKQWPQVSRRVQTRRTRKKSSGRSSGLILPGMGVPPSESC